MILPQLIHVLEVLEERQGLSAANMLRSMSIAAVPAPMLRFLYMMFPRVEWRALFAPDILRSRDSHLLSWQCVEKQQTASSQRARSYLEFVLTASA